MADTTRRKAAAKPPITSHPLFPVTVVLWFGALFGLASIAIRPALIESLVLATGIDQVVPMAAPPLGTTMRLLLALLATVVGCLIGVLVARALSKPREEAGTRRRRAAPAVEMPSPVALFGGNLDDEDEDRNEDDAETEYAELEEESPPIAVRRRQPATLTAPAEDFDDPVPMPGNTQILKVADLGLNSFDDPVDQDVWVRATARPDPNEPTREDSEFEELQATRDDPRDLAQVEEATDDHAAIEEPAPAVPERSNRLFDAYARKPAPPTMMQDETPAPGFSLLPRVDADGSVTDGAESPSGSKNDTAFATSNSATSGSAGSGYATAAERIASAPLDDLSHVELLERLALTIARRRAAAQRAHIAPPELEPEPEDKAKLQAPVQEPATPRSAWLDTATDGTGEDDDDALPGYVPPRHISLRDDDQLVAGYSSLRDFSKPARRQDFAARDDAEQPAAPPVLAFPNAEPAPVAPRAFDAPATPARSSEDTERALRAALATLQRMSGAA